jgi:ribosomal protein L23
MKSFGARISYILMHETDQDVAKTKIKGCVKHLFGECGPVSVHTIKLLSQVVKDGTNTHINTSTHNNRGTDVLTK